MALTYEKLLGIPYKFKGRDTTGVDCLGLVWLYFRSKGIKFHDTDGLPMLEEIQPDYLRRVLTALDKLFRRLDESREKPREDDIVVMRLPGGYIHLGVMVDDKNMLHVLKDRPSALSPLRRFRSRIVAVYRLPSGLGTEFPGSTREPSQTSRDGPKLSQPRPSHPR